MAKNWNFGEVVDVLAEGSDVESIKDISRRLPMTAHMVTKALAGDGNAFRQVAKAVPEYVTGRKIEKAFGGDEDAE